MSKKPLSGKRLFEASNSAGSPSATGAVANDPEVKGQDATAVPGRGSFEKEFGVVEQAIELMERGELSLEECLGEYERGLHSLKNCYQILAEAQRRIEILEGQVGSVAMGADGPVWRPAGELAVALEDGRSPPISRPGLSNHNPVQPVKGE